MDVKRWARASEIFAAVYLDTPPSSRESELARRCSGDPELEEEVRRLIASAEEKGPLDQPISALDESAQPPDNERTQTLPFWPRSLDGDSCADGEALTPGQLIGGRFRLVRILGKGGMGQVWEVLDEQLRVPRALKTIRASVARDPRAIERFKREVERAQSVTHPHVCRVYDIIYEDEIPFLSMELLSGETLAELLESRTPIDRSEAAVILRQCASALDAAHQTGLVHRDFKPSNVMVSGGQQAVRAVVMDFGLAHPAAELELSNPGAGTPAYMAPEQSAGGEITPAVDIYAFGMVACKVLTGKRPSEGGLELLSRRQRAVFLRCLDLDPARRPLSCTAFLNELHAEPWTRRRLSLALAGVAAAAISAYLMVQPTPLEKSIAILPFEQTSDGEESRLVADGVMDGVLSRLARVKELRVVPRASSSRYSPGMDRNDFADKVRARYLLAGVVDVSRGQVRVRVEFLDTSTSRTLWAETFERPETELQDIENAVAGAALAQMGVTSPGSSQPTAKETPEAHRAYRLARYHLSRRDSESLRKARNYFRVAMELEPGWALPRVGLAQTLLTMAERQDEPPKSVLPAVSTVLRSALAADPQSAEAHATLGLLVSVYHHDFALAERSFQTSIDLEPNNATAHQWYSFTLAKERRFPEALRESTIVLELDPLSVAAYQNHALVLFCAKRYEELVAHTHRLSDLDANNYWAPILRAYAHAAMGQAAPAQRELEISLQRKDPPSMLIRMAGEVNLLLGHRSKAVEFLDQLERMRASGAPTPAAYLGFLHAALGQNEDAFRWLETAWDEDDTFLSLLFVYPACDALRADPRYHQLTTRLGIRENMAQGSGRSR